MRDNGENLADERDGFVTHGMRVSNVSFDDVFEWFLDTSLELLDIQQFRSSEIITTRDSGVKAFEYLFDGCCPDDERSPHCVFHLLDAGVHVVQGHGSWGGHLFRC